MGKPSAVEAPTHNAQPWLPHRYWGKARPGNPGSGDYHPLPYHSLDVAAVGHAYLQAHPRLLSFFAQHLGMAPTATRDWLCFWLALHDLGKFASAFQGLRSDLVHRLQQRDIARDYTETVRMRSRLIRLIPRSVERDCQWNLGLGWRRSSIRLHEYFNEHRHRLNL